MQFNGEVQNKDQTLPKAWNGQSQQRNKHKGIVKERSSYDDFQKERVHTSAPILEVPGYLPKGVKFAYGQVFPYGRKGNFESASFTGLMNFSIPQTARTILPTRWRHWSC